MKLIFNPCYDSRVYVKSDGCTIDEKVVGPQGLLSELELRAGLTGRFLDDFQRAVLYSRAMKKALLANPDLFFAQSYDKDKLGTAIILLKWRDALVKIGWNSTITGCRRLDDLALVEPLFDAKGEADRWRSILEYAQDTAIIDEDDSIEVACNKDHLEPLWRQLFDSMENTGSNVHYTPSLISDDLHTKVDLFSFANDIEMAEWLAGQQLGDNDLLVCNDTSILNLELALEGKPQVGSENNAIGAIMQIFTLGLELFSNPVDVNTLLAYLQLPATPLNNLALKRQNSDGEDYYKSLRSVLFNQLLSDNGIGDEWDALIDEAVFDYEGNDVSKSDRRKNTLSFINQWKAVAGQGDDATVEKSLVVDFLNRMRKWAKTNLYDEKRASQFSAIADNCETMLLILEDEADTISTHHLKLWAAQVSRPVELATLTARKGSLNVTDAATDIHTPPTTLYWDCTMTEYHFAHELDFLNPGEADILKASGIDVPDRETLLRTDRALTLSALSKVRGRIVLLECDVKGGNVTKEAPVATELRLQGALSALRHTPQQHDMVTGKVKAASAKKGEYAVDPVDFKRDSESYSSLDELIQRPFDYVMDYILHLKQYGKAAMDDLDTLKGHVAHAYVELLTAQGNHNVSEMRKIHNSRFSSNLDLLAQTKGALLLLEENDMEFKHFKTLLVKSVDILLDIIEQNNLSIVGSEQKYEADIPDIGKMNATVDFVLKAPDGNYVVIDFKWNESKTYKEKLEHNDALQLAVYRAVLDKYLEDQGSGSKVIFTGYYVLPRHTLYTLCDTLKYNGEHLQQLVSENNNDLMLLARNSYLYRMEQLKAGIIEEGEGLELADLQYMKDTAARNLYPLRRDYNKNTLKENSYRNKNIVLKGGLI